MKEKFTKRILIDLVVIGIMMMLLASADNVKIIGFALAAVSFVVYNKEEIIKRILIAFVVTGIMMMIFASTDMQKSIGFGIAALSFVIYGTWYITGPHIEQQKRER